MLSLIVTPLTRGTLDISKTSDEGQDSVSGLYHTPQIISFRKNQP